MKKVCVFTIICLALLLLVPGVVSADGELQSTTDPSSVTQSGQTKVTYGLSAMYYLTVPQDFTLGSSTAKHAIAKITDARLPEDTMVNVSVYSVNYNQSAINQDGVPAWRMMFEGTSAEKYISYHLHSYDRQVQVDSDGDIVTDSYGNPVYKYNNENRVVNNTVFLTAHADSFHNGDGEILKSLEFKIGDDIYSKGDFAGDYWDVLVFNAGIYYQNSVPYIPPQST